MRKTNKRVKRHSKKSVKKSVKRRTRNRRNRRNLGRGFLTLESAFPIENTTRRSRPSSLSNNVNSSIQLRNHLSASNNPIGKRVVIYSPNNEVREYSLDSVEKKSKKSMRLKSIPRCRKPRAESDFPCKMKNTIFENKDEYDEWRQMQRERNYSTGLREKEDHYDDIADTLSRMGMSLARKF